MGGLKRQIAAVAGMLISAECRLEIGKDDAKNVVLTLTKQAPSWRQPVYRLHDVAVSRRCVINFSWGSNAPTRVDVSTTALRIRVARFYVSVAIYEKRHRKAGF